MARSHGDGSLHFRHDWKRCPKLDEKGEHTGRCYGVWVGQVDLGMKEDGKRNRPTVSSKSKREANKKLNDLKDRIRDTGVAPAKAITVEKWLRYWLADIANVRPNTARSYRSVIEEHIIPSIGRVRVDKLTPKHIRDVLAAPRLAALTSTRRVAYVVMSKSLTDAMRDNRTPRNVAKFVEPPKPTKTIRKALPTSEARTVLSLVARTDDSGTPLDRIGSRWSTALLTGQRQGECLGLEWDRIDWETELVDMSWQQQRLYFLHGCADEEPDGGWPCRRKRSGNCPQRILDVKSDYEYRHIDGALYWVRLKSAAGTKMIPLIPTWRAALKQREKLYLAERENYAMRTVMLPDGKTKQVRTDYGLVWCREDGRPLDPSHDNKTWHAVLKAAGVTDIELHGARHTTATLLLEAGVDAKIIAELLGQSTVVVTRGYQHVDRALLRRAMIEGIEKPLAIGKAPLTSAAIS